MTKHVYLHIGLLKTGTTYLQDGLWANKDALARQGVLVPGRHRRRHLIASLDLRDDPKLAQRTGDIAQPWQDLVDEVEAWSGRAAVISHEFFAPAAAEHIARAVRSFNSAELHVVITARVLTRLAPSLWQEWVKNGGRRGIEGFPGKRTSDPHDEWGWAAFDLADVLQRWGAQVPPERIHVLPMSADRRTTDLWERFLDLFEVDSSACAAPTEAVNVSLGLVEVEALRRINAHLEGFEAAGARSRWIRSYLATDMMPNSRERFRVSPQRHRRLVERSQAAVALLREGGYDVRGDLNDLVPSADLPDLRHPSEATEAEILEVTNRTIAAMLVDVRQRNRERYALQAELAELRASRSPVTFIRRLIEHRRVRS